MPKGTPRRTLPPFTFVGEPEAWGESADSFLDGIIEQVERGELCEECFAPAADHRADCPTMPG